MWKLQTYSDMVRAQDMPKKPVCTRFHLIVVEGSGKRCQKRVVPSAVNVNAWNRVGHINGEPAK